MTNREHPLPDGMPVAAEEWETEWIVQVERSRDEPDHWISRRWRLHELRAAPPVEFKRNLVRLVYLIAAATSRQVWVLRIQSVDALVSAERNRQIRERVTPLMGAGTENFVSAPEAPSRRAEDVPEVATSRHLTHVGTSNRRRGGPDLIATREDVERVRNALVADGKSAGIKSVAKAGGWSVATVRRRLAGN